MQKDHGYTTIELLIVFAIIVLIAAITIPKITYLNAKTQAATTTAIAASLSAANESNYVARKINGTLGHPVANCTDVANVLKKILADGYHITSAPVMADAKISCTLTGPYGSHGTFTATGIS